MLQAIQIVKKDQTEERKDGRKNPIVTREGRRKRYNVDPKTETHAKVC